MALSLRRLRQGCERVGRIVGYREVLRDEVRRARKRLISETSGEQLIHAVPDEGRNRRPSVAIKRQSEVTKN